MRLTYIFTALELVLRSIALVILSPVIVSAYYHDWNSAIPFVIASVVAFVLSFIFRKKSDTFESLNDIKKSEALCVVALSWIVFCIIGTIPYLYFGLSPINSLFESVSGITTTGATILTSFSYPKAMFFWRSMSQWLGGMGIIVLFIAVLPQFAVAGRQMFFAEAPGPTEDKITPRIRHTASAVWTIYLLVTVLEIILLRLAGMPLFDAFCNSFSSLAGGGFSPNPLSIMGYHSTLICWIMIFFMYIAGVNFALLYKVYLNKKPSLLFKDEEFRAYTGIIIAFSAAIAFVLYFNETNSFFQAVTTAVFQVISIIITAGFASVDFEQWHLTAKIFLFALFFCGACAGSAGGGLKVVRVLFLFKYLRREISKILHPNAVYPVKINKTILPTEVVQQIIAFIFFYFLIFAISAFLIAILENNSTLGITGSITTLGNIGPAFGIIGPMGSFDVLHPMSKVICIFNMIVGRLELIPFLAMLHPDFWNIK